MLFKYKIDVCKHQHKTTNKKKNNYIRFINMFLMNEIFVNKVCKSFNIFHC